MQLYKSAIKLLLVIVKIQKGKNENMEIWKYGKRSPNDQLVNQL